MVRGCDSWQYHAHGWCLRQYDGASSRVVERWRDDESQHQRQQTSRSTCLANAAGAFVTVENTDIVSQRNHSTGLDAWPFAVAAVEYWLCSHVRVVAECLAGSPVHAWEDLDWSTEHLSSSHHVPGKSSSWKNGSSFG